MRRNWRFLSGNRLIWTWFINDLNLTYPNEGVSTIANETGRKASKFREQRPEDRLSDARVLFNERQVKKAEALCRRIFRRQPRHSGALHLLGLMARGNRRPERAVQLLEEAAIGSPDDAGVPTDLGNTLKSLDRLDEAAETMNASSP